MRRKTILTEHVRIGTTCLLYMGSCHQEDKALDDLEILNGNISSSLVVGNDDEIILSTNKGSMLRCLVKEIRIAGRNTQGVRIKKLKGEEKVVSVIKIDHNIQ